MKAALCLAQNSKKGLFANSVGHIHSTGQSAVSFLWASLFFLLRLNRGLLSQANITDQRKRPKEMQRELQPLTLPTSGCCAMWENKTKQNTILFKLLLLGFLLHAAKSSLNWHPQWSIFHIAAWLIFWNVHSILSLPYFSLTPMSLKKKSKSPGLIKPNVNCLLSACLSELISNLSLLCFPSLSQVSFPRTCQISSLGALDHLLLRTLSFSFLCLAGSSLSHIS